MSKEYAKLNPDEIPRRQITNGEMRKYCQRPGKKDENGKPIYVTEQAHKVQCDVNEIIRKYDKEGLILHVNKLEYKYGDMTHNDFMEMNAKVSGAKQAFEALPSNIRNEFDNSPEKFLRFMDDPKNRDRAIELGLINPDWTPETDGLGEHVKSDEGRKKKKETGPEGSA